MRFKSQGSQRIKKLKLPWKAKFLGHLKVAIDNGLQHIYDIKAIKWDKTYEPKQTGETPEIENHSIKGLTSLQLKVKPGSFSFAQLSLFFSLQKPKDKCA
jgi:hypothetical protein